MTLVLATWVGAGDVQLPDGTVLHPGDQAQVGKAEAEQSDNWQVTKQPVASASANDEDGE